MQKLTITFECHFGKILAIGETCIVVGDSPSLETDEGMQIDIMER
jgi:hypothetical protein